MCRANSGVSNSGVVSRLRAKFRNLLREEVARTVITPEDVSGEWESLKSVLAAA